MQPSKQLLRINNNPMWMLKQHYILVQAGVFTKESFVERFYPDQKVEQMDWNVNVDFSVKETALIDSLLRVINAGTYIKVWPGTYIDKMFKALKINPDHPLMRKKIQRTNIEHANLRERYRLTLPHYDANHRYDVFGDAMIKKMQESQQIDLRKFGPEIEEYDDFRTKNSDRSDKKVAAEKSESGTPSVHSSDAVPVHIEEFSVLSFEEFRGRNEERRKKMFPIFISKLEGMDRIDPDVRLTNMDQFMEPFFPIPELEEEEVFPEIIPLNKHSIPIVVDYDGKTVYTEIESQK